MKALAKRVVFCLATVAGLPWLLFYGLGLCCGFKRPAFAICTQSLALLPGAIGDWMRTAFYFHVLRRCAWTARVSFGTILTDPDTTLGNHAYVGAYCVLGAIDIEDDVLVASQVSIPNGSKQHGIERLDVPIRDQPGCWKRIRIGCDSWIGERAVVMADVGKHCVVAAGAVVTEPVPDYAIVAGVPARIIHWRRAPQDVDTP